MPDIDDMWDDEEDMAMFSARSADRVALGLSAAPRAALAAAPQPEVIGRADNMPLADMARAEAFRTLARCIRDPSQPRKMGLSDLAGVLAWEERRIAALAAAPQPAPDQAEDESRVCLHCGVQTRARFDPCWRCGLWHSRLVADGYKRLQARVDRSAPQPATPGERMIRAAEEAVAIARGESEPASVYPAPQPTPVDREALVEVIRETLLEWQRSIRTPDWPPMPVAIADALLARGLRLSGEEETMAACAACEGQPKAPNIPCAVCGKGAVSETMAWAVVGEDGLEPDTVHPNLDHVISDLRHDQRIVRVAIRVVEGGDDAA